MGYRATLICDNCERETLDRDDVGWVTVYHEKKNNTSSKYRKFCCFTCVKEYAKKKIKKEK